MRSASARHAGRARERWALGRPAASTVMLWTRRHAAQVAVVGALDAVLADDRARLHAAVARRAELVGLISPVVPTSWAAGRAERVAAQVHLLDGDAGEVPLVLEQVVAHRLRDVDLHADVRVRQRRASCWMTCSLIAARHAEHLRQARVARGELRRGGRRDRDRLAAAALRPPRARGHLLAPGRRRVALGLRAGWRGSSWTTVATRFSTIARPLRSRMLPRGAETAHGAHAVVERVLAVLVAGQHLHEPQAQEDDREEREGDAAEDRHAQRELRGDRAACGDRDWPAGSSISASGPRERRQAAGRVGPAPAPARVLGQDRQQPAAHERRGPASRAARRAATVTRISQHELDVERHVAAEQELHQREAELGDAASRRRRRRPGRAAPCGSRSSRRRPAP